MLSPWTLGFANVALARWSNVLLGLALVVMSVWGLFGVAPADEGRTQPEDKKVNQK